MSAFPLPAGVSETDLVVSPDSRRVAYIVRRLAGEHCEVNGVASPRFARIGDIAVSDAALAYTVVADGKTYVFFGDRRFGPWSDATALSISPDSSRFVCIVRDAKEWRVVDSAQTVAGPFERVPQRPRFSPDSRRVAVVAFRDDKCVVTVDGHELGRYATEHQPHVVFSADSKQLTFVVTSHGRQFVCVNGVMTDAGARTTGLERASYPAFSPDGLHIAYIAADPLGYAIVVDGEIVARHATVLDYPLVFSRDSKHLAYAIQDEEGQAVVIDGAKTTARIRLTRNPWSFSPDSRRLVYGCLDYDRRQHDLVVGHQICRLRARLIQESAIHWDGHNFVRFAAMAGREVRLATLAVDLEER